MGNGHLISDGVEFIVRGLLNLPVTKAREVLLNNLSVLEDFFEFFAVSGHTSSGIVSYIEIFSTAIAFSGIEGRMFSKTGMVISRCQFPKCP